MVFKSIGEISADIMREMIRERAKRAACEAPSALPRLRRENREMKNTAANTNHRCTGYAGKIVIVKRS